MRDIGKNIKSLRVRKNLTQDQLAERLFVTRQTVSNYENGRSRPDIDMLVKISEVLETDIHQVIYGPETVQRKPELRRLIAGVVLTALVGILWLVLQPMALDRKRIESSMGLSYGVYNLIRPLFFLLLGWLVAQVLGMALRKKPLAQKWARWAGIILLALVLILFLLTAWYAGAVMVNEWQYENHIRGEWVETEMTVDGERVMTQGWSMLPPVIPDWVPWILGRTVHWQVRYPMVYLAAVILTGAALWRFGFPWEIEKK